MVVIHTVGVFRTVKMNEQELHTSICMNLTNIMVKAICSMIPLM